MEDKTELGHLEIDFSHPYSVAFLQQILSIQIQPNVPHKLRDEIIEWIEQHKNRIDTEIYILLSGMKYKGHSQFHNVRMGALQALGKMHLTDVIPLIFPLIHNTQEHLEIQLAAINALIEIGAAAQEILVLTVNNRRYPPQIREKALWGLMQQNYPEMKQLASSIFQDNTESTVLRVVSIDILGIVRPENCIEPLIETLGSPRRSLWEHASKTLQKYTNDEVTLKLLRYLENTAYNSRKIFHITNILMARDLFPFISAELLFSENKGLSRIIESILIQQGAKNISRLEFLLTNGDGEFQLFLSEIIKKIQPKIQISDSSTILL